MNWIIGFFEILLNMGATVMVPLFILVIALCTGVRPAQAVKAGITTGACIIGATLIANLLGGNLFSVGQMIAESNGFSAPVTDVGWQASSALASVSRSGLYAVPLCVALNLVMLLTKTTRTLNLDWWNCWQAAFMGAMVETLTGQAVYGLITTGAAMAIILVVADNTAPRTEKYLGLTGISLTHGFSASFGPIAALFNWLVDKIPGAKKFSFSLKNLKKILGYAADPVPLAAVAGLAWGLISDRSFQASAQLAVSMAAVMLLLPKAVQILIESLQPVTDGVKSFVEKKLKMQGKLYLGMSGTLGLGDPTVLLTAMILTPLCVYLAALLPGSRLIPGSDLVMIPYVMITVVAMARGDLLRSLAGGLLSMTAMLLCGAGMAELFTQAAQLSGAQEYASGQLVSNLCNGSSPLTWVLVHVNLYGVAGVVLLVVATVALLVWNRNRITGGVKLYVRQTKTIRASHIEAVETEPEELPPVPELPQPKGLRRLMGGKKDPASSKPKKEKPLAKSGEGKEKAGDTSKTQETPEASPSVSDSSQPKEP